MPPASLSKLRRLSRPCGAEGSRDLCEAELGLKSGNPRRPCERRGEIIRRWAIGFSEASKAQGLCHSAAGLPNFTGLPLEDVSIDLQKLRTKLSGSSRRFTDGGQHVLARFAGQRAGELRTQVGKACAGQTELIRDAPTFRDQEVHIHTRCPYMFSGLSLGEPARWRPFA